MAPGSTAAALVLIALAPACNWGPGMTPYDPDDADVRIDGVDPDWGPAEGGTAVTVTGEGFQGALEVSFGGVDAAATRLDDATLLVTTPPHDPGQVDVVVDSAIGRAVLEDGFTFGPDDGDTGDATGLTGGLVEMSLLQIACPDCFGLATGMDVYAAAAFHDPVAASWLDWLPSSGSCANDAGPLAPATSFIDVGEWAYLSSGSGSIPLRRTPGDGGPTYQSAGLSNEDYLRNASWDLSIPTGPQGSFDVLGALLTTEGFDDIQPWQMLYVHPESAFSAQLPRTAATVSWAPAGSGDTFVVLVRAFHPTSGEALGSAICRGPDSGSMTVPSAALTAYPTGSLLGVYLYRYRMNTSTLPLDGSTLEAVSQVGVLGTAVLR